jgi:hypothetical protein
MFEAKPLYTQRLASVETSKQGRLKRKSYASEYLTELNIRVGLLAVWH